MKHRKVWQLLLTILLMGVMFAGFAGCASAGTKTVNNIGSASVPQKAEDTSGAVKKEAAEKKDNGEKGTAMHATNMKIKVVANGKEIVFALNDTSVSRSFYAQLRNCICAERYFRVPVILCAAAVNCCCGELQQQRKDFPAFQKAGLQQCAGRGVPCGVNCLFLALEQRVHVLR